MVARPTTSEEQVRISSNRLSESWVVNFILRFL